MPDPTPDQLQRIVTAHLGTERAQAAITLIAEFARRAGEGQALSTDQLLNAVFLVTGDQAPEDDGARDRFVELLLQQLNAG